MSRSTVLNVSVWEIFFVCPITLVQFEFHSQPNQIWAGAATNRTCPLCGVCAWLFLLNSLEQCAEQDQLLPYLQGLLSVVASMVQLTVKVRKAAIPARGEKQSGMGLSGTFVDMPWASCSTSTLDAPGEQVEFFPTYLKTLSWFFCVQICASCDGNIKKLVLKVCRWSVEVYNKTCLSSVPLLSCLRSEFNWYLYLEL